MHIKYCKSAIARIPDELKLTSLLFFTTRLSLTIIGVVSRLLLEPYHGKYYVWKYSKHLWLDIWGVWDSGWYLNIARNWYPKNADLSVYTNYGFFPFYPLLMKITAFFLKDYFIAGIIVSNISLFIACFFLYRLVRLDYDEDVALNSIKYLFLFPSAFIFSGVFSESLYTAFIIAAFYYARKDKWHLVGICGYFFALTRMTGAIVVLPLLVEYLGSHRFKPLRSIFWLSLVPLGTITFFAYCQYQTSNWLAYVINNKLAWGTGFTNSFATFVNNIFSTRSIELTFMGCFTLIVLIILIICYRYIRFSYWLFAVASIIFILVSNSAWALRSMSRFILPLFPLFIIPAKLAKRHRYFDLSYSLILALLQGFLMVFWSNGFNIIV